MQDKVECEILRIFNYSSCTNFRYFRQCPRWGNYVSTNINTHHVQLTFWNKFINKGPEAENLQKECLFFIEITVACERYISYLILTINLTFIITWGKSKSFKELAFKLLLCEIWKIQVHKVTKIYRMQFTSPTHIWTKIAFNTAKLFSVKIIGVCMYLAHCHPINL